jgi:hypothetical protein
VLPVTKAAQEAKQTNKIEIEAKVGTGKDEEKNKPLQIM